MTEKVKILIVYSSKHGFTKQCVDYIEAGLEGESTVMDVTQAASVDVAPYDWVIMGSSAYMSKMNKQLKQYAERKQTQLLPKNLALFVCCMTPKDADQYMQQCFGDKIYTGAKCKFNFGGELQQAQLNFFERKMAKLAAKQPDKREEALYQNMDNLIDYINSHERTSEGLR